MSAKKAKKKRKVKTKKSKASKVCKKEKLAESSTSKKVIRLSNQAASQNKSPKKRRVRKKAKYANRRAKNQQSVNQIVQGLDDILNSMEDSAKESVSPVKPRKGSNRKMSCEIRGEQQMRSPKKSPRKSPLKKLKTRKKRRDSRRSIMKMSTKKHSNPAKKLTTIMDISAIVAGLDEVLAKGKHL